MELGSTFSKSYDLSKFIEQNHDLKLLFTKMQQSSDDFWLVGGCLRDFLLDLPQNDIDIVCAGDPTQIAKSWSAEVNGSWFWLDQKRKQSRVLHRSGLSVDFSPLRAPTISADLHLRDFCINALALPLTSTFPEVKLIDPLGGVSQLRKQQLQTCSDHSFIDDPLRLLKGIRHVATLDFSLSATTSRQVFASAQLLKNVAGERIVDELAQILAAKHVIKGVKLLADTGLLEALLGSPGGNWDKHTAVSEIACLNSTIQDFGLTAKTDFTASVATKRFSMHTVFLFAQLLKSYLPTDLPELLRSRFRLSRNLQRLILELQLEPDLKLFSRAATLDGQRLQALLVEQFNPFAYEKMLFYSISYGLLTLSRVKRLQAAFMVEQKFGHIPGLLNGRMVSSYLQNSHNSQIGKWQIRLKSAEIDGQIKTTAEAKDWLKNEVLFDNNKD